MNISDIAKARYSTKAFNPTRKIPAAKMDQIESLLRHAPSSINSQPWHFIIASSSAGKDRIAKAAHGMYSYNEPKIKNASHVIVFCSRTNFSEQHILAILDQEDRDGRFATPDAKSAQQKMRSHYANLHENEYQDSQIWMNKQLYIAFGMLLLGAAVLEIDACPMEGFDSKLLNEELGLATKGLRSSVIVCLGYRSDDDFNASLPKSRLPLEVLITRI